MYVRCSFIYICVPMHNAFQSRRAPAAFEVGPKLSEILLQKRTSSIAASGPLEPTLEILNWERSTSEREALPTAPGSNWSNMLPYETAHQIAYQWIMNWFPGVCFLLMNRLMLENCWRRYTFSVIYILDNKIVQGPFPPVKVMMLNYRQPVSWDKGSTR